MYNFLSQNHQFCLCHIDRLSCCTYISISLITESKIGLKKKKKKSKQKYSSVKFIRTRFIYVTRMYNRCFLSRLGEYRGGDNLNYTRGDQPEAKYGKVVKKIANTPPSVRLCGGVS